MRWGFPGGSDSIESTCNAGHLGSIPGSGRSPGEGNGYPLQYSCLENPKERGAWWVTAHGFAKTQLSDEHTHTHHIPRPHSENASLTYRLHVPKYIKTCLEEFLSASLAPYISANFTSAVCLVTTKCYKKQE